MTNATVTIKALAARLGLTSNAIRRLEQITAFPAHVPGSWTYRVRDVDAWLAETTDGRVSSLDEVPSVLVA